MHDARADLLSDITFALRHLDPWPPREGPQMSKRCAERVLQHLELAGWQFTRRAPVTPHSAGGTPQNESADR